MNEIITEMPLEIRQNVLELAVLMKKHFGVYPTIDQVVECVRGCVEIKPKEIKMENAASKENDKTVKYEVIMDEETKTKYDSISKHFETTIGFKPSPDQLFLFMLNMTHKSIFGPMSPFQQVFNALGPFSQPIPSWNNQPGNTFERTK